MGRAAGQGHCRIATVCGLVCVFRTFLKQEMIKKNNKKKSKYISPFFFFFEKREKSYGTWVCELYKKDTHIVLFRLRKEGYV